MQALIRYTEPLATEERAFLVRRVQREQKGFFRLARALAVLCFIIPFLFAWYKAAEGMPRPFAAGPYFAGVGFLMTLAGAGLWFSYMRTLSSLVADLRRGTKTVEQTHITRKVFMPGNSTYYFYLDSPTRLSIEISEEDYQRMAVGDELSIEYSSTGQVYFGYF